MSTGGGENDPPEPSPDPVAEVFAEWQQVLGHPNARLDKKRATKIRDGLAAGFTVDQLKRVPHGVLRSPHHLGVNESGIRYDDVVTIFRDVPQIEKFIELAKQPIRRSAATSSTDADIDLPVIVAAKPLRASPKIPAQQADLWRSVLSAIKKRVGPDNYTAWFAADKIAFDGLNDEKNAFLVRCTPTVHEWVTRTYAPMLYEVLIECGLGEFTFTWEIERDEVEEAMAA